MSDISVLIEHSVFALAKLQKNDEAVLITMQQMRRVLFPGKYSAKTVSAQMRDLRKAVAAAVETKFVNHQTGISKFTSSQERYFPYVGFSEDSTFDLTPKGYDFATYVTPEEIGLKSLRAAYR